MIDKAQIVVDAIVGKIMETGYKIPASQQAFNFLELMLNANGFSNAHVEITPTDRMPIVVHVEKSKDIFVREGHEQ